MSDLVKKLRSQIGDDVQEVYCHSALFRLAADRIEELEAAIDSAEIKHGLTSNGNLWRFWSKRACDAAKQSAELDAENARLCGALNKLDNLTARDAAIVTAALQEQEKSDG